MDTAKKKRIGEEIDHSKAKTMQRSRHLEKKKSFSKKGRTYAKGEGFIPQGSWTGMS